ncbi:hypothetical protein BBJ28_00017399 [Nothophytophthora sp. Chile5]|nr:hypothetical protein BBJ28_00017399 [Nothophytophthora sp. Chile5]
MATSCPWQVAAPVAASTSPSTSRTLQEIMDEELAQRLQEEENNHFAGSAIDTGASLFEDPQVDDAFEDKEPAPVDAEDDYAEYEEEEDQYADGYTHLTAAFAGNGKGLTSFRESMRRQEKLESRRGTTLTPAHVDLGKHGGDAHESLFDERTQFILRKLMASELVTDVQTRVHTGREANVYHGLGRDATTGRERALALKIFKSSKGDYSKFNECDPTGRRYDVRFVKKSIRRQLKLWTEREHRHLSRAAAALATETVTEAETELATAGHGVRVPRPLLVREHILITEFVGTDGHSAISLKDASLNSTQLRNAYADLLRAVRLLYQRARLVHGQLTAANILYHNGQCWLMDLGHAVEVNAEGHDELLTRDLDSIEAFFRSRGVPTVAKHHVGLLDVETAKDYVVAESTESLLRRFPAMEALLRD